MAAIKITWLQTLADANNRLLDPVFFRSLSTMDISLLLDIKFHSVRVTLHNKTVQIIHLHATLMVQCSPSVLVQQVRDNS